MDIDSPSRAFPTSTNANTLHFGTNTPFIFHSAPAPRSSQYEPYDPTKWASKDFKFGFGGKGGVGVEEDVEMRFGDSPRRKQVVEGAAEGEGEEADASADRPVSDGKGNAKGKGKGFEVGQAEGGDEGERKIASGAITRVRRKRQKEWRKRRESDSEPDEVGHVGPMGT
jgi:hypothetical protein